MSLKSLPEYRRKGPKALVLAGLIILNLSWIAPAYNITISGPVAPVLLDSETVEQAVVRTEGKGFGFTVSEPHQSLQLVLKKKLKHAYHVFWIAISPDSRHLAAAGILDKTVTVWDVQSGKTIVTLTDQVGSVEALAYSPDGRYLAAGRGFLAPAKNKMSVNLWDANTGKLIHNIPGLFPEAHDASNDIKSMAFGPNSQILAMAAMDKNKDILLYDVNHASLVKRITREGPPVFRLIFSPDGRHLAAGTIHGVIEIWEVDSGTIVRDIKAHTSMVNALAYSTDGKFLVSGTDSFRDKQKSNKEPIKLWDSASGNLVRTFAGHTGIVESLAFSTDSRYLASGSQDSTVKLWNPVSGELLGTAEHGDLVYSIAFSQKGQYLASAGGKYVKLWEIQP